METRSAWRATPQVILGLIIVTVGVFFTLDEMGILYAWDYLRYWPALLVVFGVSKMLQPKSVPGRFVGFLFTLVGGLWLLDKLDVVDFRVWDFWPLIIVLIGLSIIWRSFARRTTSPSGVDGTDSANSSITGVAVMSGFKRTSSTQTFSGGELTAIMGGCEIDLRQASMKDGEAVLDVFAFWGGIELKVPLDWSVDIQATPLLGGFDDKTRPPQGGSAKRLVIKGFAIMGGCEVTN